MPCLVIGPNKGSLETTGELAPASLEGVRVMVPADSRGDTDAVGRLVAAGATLGISFTADSLPAAELLKVAGFAVIEPPTALASGQRPPARESSFLTRRSITALRAVRPDLTIVIDADSFIAEGVGLDALAPYADAVLGSTGSWSRLAPAVAPDADELLEASLTAGSERFLLPVRNIRWNAVMEFAARRAALVDVGGVRPLTADEIVARHQARQRRQDESIQTTVASGSTTLLFEVPGYAAPITITADTTVFRTDDEANIVERNIRVNGAAIAGGGASSAPELPLIEADRIASPPLAIALTADYRYVVDSTESVNGASCYVISFEPVTSGPGRARGRAWIARADFTLRRLETVQTDLRGAIVSSAQVDEFGSFEVSGGVVWLPIETRVSQAFEGAGLKTPIHRAILVSRYAINSPRFQQELQAAFDSNDVMLRETETGLRYLVRGREGDRRVDTRVPGAVRGVVAGVIVDPNITRPLPYAGLSYVNVNLGKRRAQVNIFFGGVYGQGAWSIPAVAGTRWTAHGSAFGIAARWTDRVFRDGREQYSENLQQRPSHVSVGVMRAVTPQVHATFDYQLDVTTLGRSAGTSSAFRVPRNLVSHGALIEVDLERTRWSARTWWNPAWRQGWEPWGFVDAFERARRRAQRYGAQISGTVALGSVVTSRVQGLWMGGRNLDRFSRYGFDTFDNPLHGYATGSIRYDQGAVFRSVTAWARQGWRVDAFGDLAIVRDAAWAGKTRAYPGMGVGVESAGPFRTLWSLEWGYGPQAPRLDGRRGAQTVRINVFRGF